MIGIIDYKMGNLRSVQKALQKVGADAVILANPEQAKTVDKLILPGVGAFADGITHLTELGWVQPMQDFIATGKPFLGICLGLQLIFDSSEEDAPSPDQLVKGLSFLPGQVLRFTVDQGDIQNRLKVPHMGWNTITWQLDDPLFKGLDQNAAVYFVHSYYAKPADADSQTLTSAQCDYGSTFTASVWNDNIWATQFHPEKSQKVGLKMLENFAGF